MGGGFKKKNGPVVVEREVIKSKAFWSLKVRKAPQVYLAFLSKRQLSKIGPKGKEKWIITNNGDIVFTYKDAWKKYGLSKRQFSKVLRELHEKGFIDIAHHGGAYRQDSTKFSMSERWLDYDSKAFIEEEWPEDNLQRGYRKPKRVKSNFSTYQTDTRTHVPNGYP